MEPGIAISVPLLSVTAILLLASLIWHLWQRKRRIITRDRQKTAETSGPTPESVPPLALGIKAYMKGDHHRAEPTLRHYAEAGELKAQQLLAKMYYSGHGVPQDMELYRYWLQQAAAGGDRSAKAHLKKFRKSQDSSR